MDDNQVVDSELQQLLEQKSEAVFALEREVFDLRRKLGQSGE